MSALPTPICRDDTQHGVDYYTRADLEAHAAAQCAPLVEILHKLSEAYRHHKGGPWDKARAFLAAHKEQA